MPEEHRREKNQTPLIAPRRPSYKFPQGVSARHTQTRQERGSRSSGRHPCLAISGSSTNLSLYVVWTIIPGQLAAAHAYIALWRDVNAYL